MLELSIVFILTLALTTLLVGIDEKKYRYFNQFSSEEE